MPDRTHIRVATAPARALVSLRVSRRDAEDARQRLDLAAPLRAAGEAPQNLWLGPDHWLLVGPPQTALAMVEECDTKLVGLLYNAVDQSAAYAALRLEGPGARAVLASGAGLDFREPGFPRGDCRPTRLAQIAAVIVATGTSEFEIYVDCAYRSYLRDWLEDTALVGECAAGGAAT